MRIHSRVDLYAKVVALAGLGCLGLAGALLDYWPTPGILPAVPSALEPGGAPSVLTVVDVPGFTSVAPGGISLTLAAPRPARRPSPRVDTVVLNQAPGARATLGRVDVAEPHPRPLPVVVGAGVLVGLRRVELSSAPIPAPPPPVSTRVLNGEIPRGFGVDTALAFDPGEDDGFFPGVLKKTGSSVTASIGKAGNSLVGAFRAVGGAVKRAF